MALELRTAVEIAARPAEVWAIVVDLTAYSRWNPFITYSQGIVAEGERLTHRVESPGGVPLTVESTVTKVCHGRAVEWFGRLALPGLLDGRHRLEIVPSGEGALLTHEGRFTGLLVRVYRRRLETRTRVGFEAMGRALKARAEGACWS